MKKWFVGVALVLFLTAGVVCVVAAPAWYECDVKWAGAGGGGVYIVLQNTNSFPTTLGPAFPANTIMVAGSADDATEANRILATALAAQAGGKKVMVFTEPISFSTIGGLYSVEP
ncbi:MAG: hypothetical protein HQ523_02000 [Lentisphaerae bacterium]|nr:hypothetical protein [Lentisphaerota bacterium]